MKRSRPRSPFVVAVASLALMASSCSLLDVPNDVEVKAVPVDLNFGAEIFKQPAVPTIGELPTQPPIDLDLPEEPTPPARPRPPLCPISTKDAPDNESQAELLSAQDMPIEGSYKTLFEGNFEGGGYMATIGDKVVEEAVESADASEYTFTVVDDAGAVFPGMKMSFRVVYTRSEPEPDGIYLTKLVLPEIAEDGSRSEYTFTPNPALHLVAFPIVQGTRTISEGADAEPKTDTGIPNPLTGGTILQPSGNNVKSVFEIGGRETIEVCADLAQAWRANWNIEVTGEFNVTVLGSFWFDTSVGKGGMPIKADYVVSGDVTGGAFAASLMRIDPGDTV